MLFFAMVSGRQGFGPPELLPAAALTLAVLALVRRAPLPAVALLTTGWAAAVVEMPKAEVALMFALCADGAVGYLALTRDRRISLTALAMTLGAQIGCALYLVPIKVLPLTFALAALTGLIAWMTGASMRQSRRHAREPAARSAAEAVTAERLRIARELHDMVAHSIGVIAIQAGVGSRVIDTQPSEARNALTAIEETSRDTLAGLRRMLGALRRTDDLPVPHGPAPGLAELDRLVRTTGDAGVEVDVRWDGERRALPAEVDLSAFRIVQEAVTNVVRHAHTRRCRVSVGYRPARGARGGGRGRRGRAVRRGRRLRPRRDARARRPAGRQPGQGHAAGGHPRGDPRGRRRGRAPRAERHPPAHHRVRRPPGRRPRRPPRPAAPRRRHRREREVLGLVARGRSNAEIAESLSISPATAKAHVARLLTKLDARDRVHLVIQAYESGIAPPPA